MKWVWLDYSGASPFIVMDLGKTLMSNPFMLLLGVN